ncbi:hypothetical protein Tco_0655097 [Tanacetum coccineum]|uniref:Uncharacterized protein n=1 Tax=Tanacetum coccineum TaxID=301880 RepID=A0ABQ4X521_9ASTR
MEAQQLEFSLEVGKDYYGFCEWTAKNAEWQADTSKKKVSISADDNIIPEPDIAFELGKSISLTEAEEEEAARRVQATHERLVILSNESDPEPARRPIRRKPYGITFRDTSRVSKKKSHDQSQKLQGIQTLTTKEQLATDTMQALKSSRKISRSQSHTGGSSKGASVTPKVPGESTCISKSSSERTGTILAVLNEVKGASKVKPDPAIDWMMMKDEFVHGDEYVNDNVDEEMKDAKDSETRKDDEEMTDAEKDRKTQRKHDDQDEDPTARSGQGKDKKRPRKDIQPSKKSSAFKESSKGNTPPKSSKSGKFVNTEEPDEEHVHDMSQDDEENIADEMGNADEYPDGEAAPKNDWFKQPPRPPTPDPEWNKCQVDPLTFDELMATPIDFSKFEKNRLKLDKITKEDLVGPVFNLLKGTYQSSIELEYNKEECYKALIERLDWENPKEYFFNNDLEYLKSIDSERKYTTSIIKIKVLAQQILKPDVYSQSEDSECEGDFVNLHLNDIEDMLLLVVQRKLFYLNGEVIVDLAVALHMFTRSLIIKKRVEDVQLGIMVDLINKQMLERRILRNLERLVGARELEMDYRLM